jgi:hypothetical protein
MNHEVTDHAERLPIAIPIDQLKQLASTVADELRQLGGSETVPNTGGGSLHRNLPEHLRQAFVDVRAALFQRGIYDPVLVRFDTASAPQATNLELADQLAAVAAAL